MVEVISRTTDTYSFEIDGKGAYFFDEATLRALLQAHELAKRR
jgi:hypothetical protein